jgi:hypothetical protein
VKEFTQDEKQAICDALNALYEKADVDVATWLKVCAPRVLYRALRINIVRDYQQQEFRS